MSGTQDKEDRKARRWRKKKRKLYVGLFAGLLFGLALLTALFVLKARFDWWAPPLALTTIFTILASWLLIDGLRERHPFFGQISSFLFLTGISCILWMPFGTNHFDIVMPIVSMGIFFVLGGSICARGSGVVEGTYEVKSNEIRFSWFLIVSGIMSFGFLLWIAWGKLDPISTLFIVTIASIPLILGLSGFMLYRMSQKSRKGRRVH